MSNETAISELLTVATAVLKSLRKDGYEVVTLDNDAYWSIDGNEAYNTDEEPKDLTIGLISDNLNELRLSCSDPEEHPILPYHLVWLGAVLTAVGRKLY